MLGTLEEADFEPNSKKFIKTFEKSHHTKVDRSITEDEAYEEAIKALNTLQSNATTIRRSIELNVKQADLSETLKYLTRSGLTLEDAEKLSVIHVSGTKGKGSTCALVESILRGHGVKTGFFSSPHLISVTERIRINGMPISKQKFVSAFWRVYRNLEAAQEYANDMPAYFKFLTILSFHIFLEEQVDVVILEVGIGGECDCTNVLRNTKTVGITSLGLEHTQLLGNTLEEIAWQKAGIIKTHSNVYTSVTEPQCLKVIQQRAAERNATVTIVPEFSAYCQNAEAKALLTHLNNVIQLNLSLAIQLAYDWLRANKNTNELHELYSLNSTKLNKTVLEALTECSWPGRCQLIKFQNFNIHLDGAHTIESIKVCSDWYEKVTKNSPNIKVLIFNTTGDRDSKKLLNILLEQNNFDVACFVPNIAASNGTNITDNQSVYGIAEQIKRAKMHNNHWQTICEEYKRNSTSKVFNSIFECIKHMRTQYGTQQELDVLVTGSLHLIGATLLALQQFKIRFE